MRCPWPTDLRAFAFVLGDVPDIPQEAALLAAAAASNSPAAHTPAAEAAPAPRRTMEADRHRREPPPTATAWPGCPTPGGAWSAGGPGRPGRPGRGAWCRRPWVEGRAGVDRPAGYGHAAGVAWRCRRRRDTTPSSPFFTVWVGGKIAK